GVLRVDALLAAAQRCLRAAVFQFVDDGLHDARPDLITRRSIAPTLAGRNWSKGVRITPSQQL
ncbi:MAG: hypothetical protein ACK5X3_07460, partial [Pseudomonadota bacterium]